MIRKDFDFVCLSRTQCLNAFLLLDIQVYCAKRHHFDEYIFEGDCRQINFYTFLLRSIFSLTGNAL